MIILLLKGYNNYFNRIVKKEDSITAYKEASTSYLEYPNVNFDPNDGVITSLVVGGPTQKLDTVQVLDFEDSGSPDYLIAYVNTTNDGPIIKSRWFITECDRVRNGQYKLSLKRDSLVDYFDDIKEAPCFIEKATITDTNNVLLYNNEGFNVNQIKTSETLIKDSSGVPWIVGYVSSKLSTGSKETQITTIPLNNAGYATGSFVYTASTSFSKIYIEYNGTRVYGGDSGFTYSFDDMSGVLTYTISQYLWRGQTVAMYTIYTSVGEVNDGTYKMTPPGDESRNHLQDAPYDMFCIPFGEIRLNTANITTTKDAAMAIAFEFAKDLGKESIYDLQLLPYCPKQDMILSGRVYEILGTNGRDYNYIYDSNSNIKSIVLWCEKSTGSINVLAESTIELNRPTESTATTMTASSTNASCGTSGGYSSVSFTDPSIKGLADVTVTGVSVSKDSYNASSQGISNFGYNPDTGYIMGKIYTPGFPTGSSNGWTARITFTYHKYLYPEYLDYKVSNQCDVYRLVSPNYNGQFEWSLAKSSGVSNIFNIDFTYKPHTPYIHVTPIFSKLYGTDFDDARGLICGGDFSLPIITDAWTEYQVQNKNYQEIFDRQIEHMDVNNSIQADNLAWSSGMNIFNAAQSGVNSMIGAGAKGNMLGVGAAGASLAINEIKAIGSAIFNQDLMLRGQGENRSFAYDMFNYGLQNVQALPYGLTKVGAYNANNKIFPMVEYFTCSDIEKQAFRDKLKYNGMSVNVIGKIEDYMDNSEKRFIKAQLIRLEIPDDSHVVNDIYNELIKGAYI